MTPCWPQLLESDLPSCHVEPVEDDEEESGGGRGRERMKGDRIRVGEKERRGSSVTRRSLRRRSISQIESRKRTGERAKGRTSQPDLPSFTEKASPMGRI